jgi:hypothetical protein
VTQTQTVTPPPPPPATAFGDGDYTIGTEVQPGRYRTINPAEAVSSVHCYVDVTNPAGDIKVQEVTPKGHTIIIIKPEHAGSILSSARCGAWQKVG